MGVVPGPKYQFYEDIIAFLSKNTFNNIGEKHKDHFMGLPMVF